MTVKIAGVSVAAILIGGVGVTLHNRKKKRSLDSDNDSTEQLLGVA